MGSGDSRSRDNAGRDRTMMFAAMAMVVILAVSFVGIWYGMNTDHRSDDAAVLEDGTFSYTATYNGTVMDISAPASITVTDGTFDSVVIDGKEHGLGTDRLRSLDGSVKFSNGTDVISADRFVMGSDYVVTIHDGKVFSFTYYGDDITMKMVLDG